MKRIFSVLLVLLLLTGILAMSGCGRQEEPAETEKAGDNSANTFIVGFDAGFPPYGFMDDSGPGPCPGSVSKTALDLCRAAH